MCPQCGFPEYLCHSDDSVIQFKIKADKCHAKAAIEAEEKKRSDRKSDDKGVVLRPEPKMADGTDWVRLRSPYYKLLSQIDSK